MTTSSDNESHIPAKPELQSDSWTAIADHLVATSLESFSLWMDDQLKALELAQAKFVTRRTVIKSLRR